MEKHYSVNWKDDELVSIEVDGVEYASLEEIPDEEDRTQIELMMMGEVGKLMVEQASSGDGMTKVVLGIFLAVGALMLVIFAISTLSTLRAISREESAQGRVVDMITRRDENGNEFYYPIVQYNLPDGSMRRVQIPYGSWPAAYQAGDEVTLRYDPERPLEAHIASAGGSDRWILPGVTGFLGVIFTVVALLVGKLFNVQWRPAPAASKPAG